jgi:hypothetical protein
MPNLNADIVSGLQFEDDVLVVSADVGPRDYHPFKSALRGRNAHAISHLSASGLQRGARRAKVARRVLFGHRYESASGNEWFLTF